MRREYRQEYVRGKKSILPGFFFFFVFSFLCLVPPQASNPENQFMQKIYQKKLFDLQKKKKKSHEKNLFGDSWPPVLHCHPKRVGVVLGAPLPSLCVCVCVCIWYGEGDFVFFVTTSIETTHTHAPSVVGVGRVWLALVECGWRW